MTTLRSDEIFAAYNVLGLLASARIPVKTKREIYEIRKALEDHYDPINETRQDLAEEYGEVSPAGRVEFEDDEAHAEFQDEMAPIWEEEREVEIPHKIPFPVVAEVEITGDLGVLFEVGLIEDED